jgi:predicted nucleic acid-binding protein
MDAVDSSILVAALVDSEPDHDACTRLLDRGGLSVYAHGLSEVFSSLTGGRSGYRLPAREVAEIIESELLPYVEPATLSVREMLAVMRDSRSRGVRGGAIYDYLHLVAARKVRAPVRYTLNISDFRAFHRPGDPEIVHP